MVKYSVRSPQTAVLATSDEPSTVNELAGTSAKCGLRTLLRFAQDHSAFCHRREGSLSLVIEDKAISVAGSSSGIAWACVVAKSWTIGT